MIMNLEQQLPVEAAHAPMIKKLGGYNITDSENSPYVLLTDSAAADNG